MSLVSALSVSRPTLPAFMVIGLCWGAIAALIPQLKASIGASDALFGALLLASALGLSTSLWLAPLADRRLGRYGLPVGGLLVLALFPLLGLASGPLGYGVLMLCLGAASGLTDVLANARVSDLEARHKRGLMNVNHATFSFAYALAAILAGAGREAAWHPSLILAVPAFLCLCLVPFMAIVPAVDDDRDATGRPSRLPLLIVGLCGAIVLVGFMTEAAVEAWSALHIERTLGGRAAEGALGPAMLGLTMGVGRMMGQAASDRLSDLAVLRGAALMAALGAAIAAAAPVPGVAYLGFAIVGLGVSVIGPLGIALAGRMVTPGQRTRAISRAAVIGFCGFFAAPPVMGLIAELAGLRAAFFAVAVFVLLTVPLVSVFWRCGPPGKDGKIVNV